jgi:hypothetical protein
MTVLIAYFKLSFLAKNHAANRVSQPFSTLNLKRNMQTEAIMVNGLQIVLIQSKKGGTL